MDIAELGTIITAEADVREAMVESDMGAWVALVSGEVAAFGSLRHLAKTRELRARFAAVPEFQQGALALLRRIGTKAERRGAPMISLWQVTGGVASPWLEELSWQKVRTYLRMSLELPREPSEAVTAADVRVRPADGDAGLRLVHEIIEEAQSDHWDHRPLDFETFLAEQESRPGHDAGLRYVASVHDEPAGALVARTADGEGVIAFLGTRHRFRRRGVGSALLLRAFAELAIRGARRVMGGAITTTEPPSPWTRRAGETSRGSPTPPRT